MHSHNCLLMMVHLKEEFEDRLAAFDADDGSCIPHEMALAIMGGGSPVVAFRNHLSITLCELAARTKIIERAIKLGSPAALSRTADAFGTTLDVLVKLRIERRRPGHWST